MKLWTRLALIITALLLASDWIKAQSTFAIPFTLNQSNVSFSLDSSGAFIVAAPQNGSDDFMLPTGSRFVWLPAYSDFIVGNNSYSEETTELGQDCVLIGKNVNSYFGFANVCIGDDCNVWSVGSDSVVIGYSNWVENGISIGSFNSGGAFSTITLGSNCSANEEGAVACGNSSTSSGSYATAFGNNVSTSSYGAFVVGNYNSETTETGDTPNSYDWVATDPLFEIGNGMGTGSTPTSNALVIYKDGNAILQGMLKVSPSPEIPMYTGN